MPANIYFQIDGVKGTATAEGFNDWITIKTVSIEFGSAGWLPKKKRATKASELSFGNLILTKEVDSASAEILKMLYAPPDPDGNIMATLKVVNDKSKLIYQCQLEDVTISSVTLNTDLDGETYEVIQVAYGIIKWDFKSPPGKTSFLAGYDREKKKPT